MQVPMFNITCPQWALPREHIPLHVKIEKGVVAGIDRVKITLPDCLELVDTINIADYQSDGAITVTEIEKSEQSDYDYFGIVIATTEPFAELKKQVPIKIDFIYRDGGSESTTHHVRIFRPHLEFEQVPENIVLTENNRLNLPISMRFSGFGEISIRAECVIGGDIVSEGTSVLDEILRRMVSQGIMSGGEHPTDVRIDRNYIEKTVVELREQVSTDADIRRMIRDKRIDKDLVDELYELIRSHKHSVVDLFYKTVEVYLAQIVSDLLSRNLSDNSHLESQTKIRTLIKVSPAKMSVKFFYKDLLGNEYEPIEKTIMIIDERSNTAGVAVEIPLDITNVDESAAFKNVSEMVIGS